MKQAGIKLMTVCLLAGGLCCTSGCEERTSKLIRRLKEERNIETCDGPEPKRFYVAEELGNSGDPRAIPPLIEVLRTRDEDVLSPGAAGCQPGAGGTYPAVIRALAKFGPSASGATPRLIELLHDTDFKGGARPENGLTPAILAALREIEPASAIEITIKAFQHELRYPPLAAAYLTAFLKFGPSLKQHAGAIASRLKQVDASALPNGARADLLELLLDCGAPDENSEQLDQLLSDPNV